MFVLQPRSLFLMRDSRPNQALRHSASEFHRRPDQAAALRLLLCRLDLAAAAALRRCRWRLGSPAVPLGRRRVLPAMAGLFGLLLFGSLLSFLIAPPCFLISKLTLTRRVFVTGACVSAAVRGVLATTARVVGHAVSFGFSRLFARSSGFALLTVDMHSFMFVICRLLIRGSRACALAISRCVDSRSLCIAARFYIAFSQN